MDALDWRQIANALIQKVETKSGIWAEIPMQRWMNPAVHPRRLTTIRRQPHPKDHQQPQLSRAAHADGMALSDPVLELSAFDVLHYLAIPENSLQLRSCPFWSVLANFERVLQA